jgi:hypothetical protein
VVYTSYPHLQLDVLTFAADELPEGLSIYTSSGRISGTLSGPAGVYQVVVAGWVVLGDEPSVKNARRFPSRENPNPEMRPKLTVEYSPMVVTKSVPTMGRVALLLLPGLMLMILWFNRKTKQTSLSSTRRSGP